MFNALLFFSILPVLPLQTQTDKTFTVVEDLTPRRQVYDGKSWSDKVTAERKAVHLSLDLSRAHGRYLLIGSKKPYYIFINSAFAGKGHQELKLNADSLQRKFSDVIFLSVYQEAGVDDLSLQWVTQVSRDAMYNPRRPAHSFSNFLLIASLGLLLFFTALFRTNPQLTLDYLNVAKLFYLRDRDENQITLRITSSVNLLFYLFCSLLAALALILAAHFSGPDVPLLDQPDSWSGSQYFGQWVLLALGVLGMLMAKLIFASLFSLMYGWDIASFQFFYFVRVLILTLTLIAAVSLACFSFQIELNHFVLLRLGCLLMMIGAGWLFFKLQVRTSFHSFHLFSYLCATEIFPLVILVKVLLF